MNVKINYFNIEKDKQLLFNYIKDKKISFVYCAASVEFSRQIMNILNSVDKNIKLSISNNNFDLLWRGNLWSMHSGSKWKKGKDM